jgi:hypothetical protein
MITAGYSNAIFSSLCPGIHYAEASLFITIVSILATFDAKIIKDEDGNDIVPVAESANALIL